MVTNILQHKMPNLVMLSEFQPAWRTRNFHKMKSASVIQNQLFPKNFKRECAIFGALELSVSSGAERDIERDRER